MNTVTRVEKHIFKDNRDLDELCFLSKNLYNSGLYLFRQSLIHHNQWLNYNDIYHQIKQSDDYQRLPAQVAQQTLRRLWNSIKSFIKSIQDYRKNPNKYLGRPKLPKYLDKQDGRFVISNPGRPIKRIGDYLRLSKGIFIFKTGLPQNTKINEIRIIPRIGYHKIEVVYEKQVEPAQNLKHSKYMSIDLGLQNLMAITIIDTNRPSSRNRTDQDVATLVKGGHVKSVNQYFNYKSAKLKSDLSTKNGKHFSKQLSRLNLKRDLKIEDIFHKASRRVIDLCVKHGVKNIVIGNNKGWKQDANMGKKNNQNFVQVPFAKLIHMIRYKAEELGITVQTVEESYTSKVDHLAGELMQKQSQYLGKRKRRGLFQSSIGKLLNADINGAIGILRKAVGDDFIANLANRGDVFSPMQLRVV
jgi:putative transposase